MKCSHHDAHLECAECAGIVETYNPSKRLHSLHISDYALTQGPELIQQLKREFVHKLVLELYEKVRERINLDGLATSIASELRAEVKSRVRDSLSEKGKRSC
jgi:hypothetical protein